MNHRCQGLTAGVLVLALVASGGIPAGAADSSKVDAAAKDVEAGAKKIGKGVEETAKGIGNTVVEGGKLTGEKLKEAGQAAEPPAKNAWHQVKEGAVSFGTSVKTFFGKLFGN